MGNVAMASVYQTGTGQGAGAPDRNMHSTQRSGEEAPSSGQRWVLGKRATSPQFSGIARCKEAAVEV